MHAGAHDWCAAVREHGDALLHAQVLDCRTWQVEEMPESRFFDGYLKGGLEEAAGG